MCVQTESQLGAIKGTLTQKSVTAEVESEQTQVEKQNVPKTSNVKKEADGSKKSNDVAVSASKQRGSNMEVEKLKYGYVSEYLFKKPDSTLTVLPISAEPLKMENVSAEEKPAPLKCVTEKTETNFEVRNWSQTMLTRLHVQNESESTTRESVTSSLPSPVRDISPLQTSRPLGTPDSGMISDMTEVKNAAVETAKPSKEHVDPEKLTGRDGRRYRQKLKKEAELAALNSFHMVEQNEQSPNVQTGRTRTESESSTKKGEPTGKEKRRLKDKLRKEKRMQEKDTLDDEKVATEQEETLEQAAQNVEQNTTNISFASENIASITKDNIDDPSSEQVEAVQNTPEPAVDGVSAVETVIT